MGEPLNWIPSRDQVFLRNSKLERALQRNNQKKVRKRVARVERTEALQALRGMSCQQTPIMTKMRMALLKRKNPNQTRKNKRPISRLWLFLKPSLRWLGVIHHTLIRIYLQL
jgi:hypothetical protein